MADFRNTSEYTRVLTEIAHQLIERGDFERGDSMLGAIHEIRGSSLRGNLPDPTIMSSLESLMSDGGIAFAVIGAMALIVHGQVRDTNDIDVLAARLPDPTKTRDPDYMRTLGFYPSRSSTGTVQVFEHRKEGQVEVLIANDPLREWALTTAKVTALLGMMVPVVSAAALIGLKVTAMFNNPARVPKDTSDIVSVLVHSRPDLTEVLELLSPEGATELRRLASVVAR